MRNTNPIVFVIFILFFNASFAWEVDNYTYRYEPIRDSIQTLNNEVNNRLKTAEQIANTGIGCNKKILTEAVHSQFMSFILGRLEAYAEYSENIDRIKVDFADSIYQKPYNTTPTLQSSGVCSNINLNNTRIGTDKLGHFFDQGYELYLVARGNRKNVITALKYSMALEEGIYGAVMTSIKSFGDLVANYEGFLFWTNLHENKNPYFICENHNWVLKRNFNWADYINAGWDEAINCSEFTSKERASAIKYNAQKLEQNERELHGRFRRYQCPTKPIECKILKLRYKNMTPYLLGSGCS